MRRSLLAGVAAAAGLAACGRDNSVAPTAPVNTGVRSVIVSPSDVPLVPGEVAQLVATVTGEPGNDQRVRWSLIGSPYIFVSASGMVTGCWPGGHATVLATSLVDARNAGAADVVVATTAQSIVSFSSISYSPSGVTAHLDSIAGAITVAANFAQPQFSCYAAAELDLVLTSARGDTVVGRQLFPTAPSAPVTLPFAFNSAATQGGQPLFPNGSYLLRLDAVFPGTTTVASNTLALTLRNP